jgi:hypothetical protein
MAQGGPGHLGHLLLREGLPQELQLPSAGRQQALDGFLGHLLLWEELPQ